MDIFVEIEKSDPFFLSLSIGSINNKKAASYLF